MKNVILSRHKPTQKFLLEKFPQAEIKEHLENTQDVQEGDVIIGNAPLPMIAEIILN